MATLRSPWLFSARYDGAWILAPLFVPALVVLLLNALPVLVGGGQGLGALDGWEPALFLCVVVGFDVSHVWSTLLRTYLDPLQRNRHRTLLSVAPVAAFAGLVFLSQAGSGIFWRVLAYLAAFHFVRQQYGFYRLYERGEANILPLWRRRLGATAIHASALGPLAYWHTHGQRSFHWFVQGDFVQFDAPGLGLAALAVSAAVVCITLALSARDALRGQPFNVPKTFVLVGTAFTWSTGIVLLDDDAAFTLTNVLAHGIPYLALVHATSKRSLPAFFFAGFFLLAYGEEWLWNVLVWNDRPNLFPSFGIGGSKGLDEELKILVVAALATPQITHYVVDGFIWKAESPR